MLGRKSLAEKYYEETPEYEEEGTWLFVYDFTIKPNPRFWSNLRKLLQLIGNGSTVQYSVLMIKSKRGVIALGKLARHYGATIIVFKGEEIQI